LKPSQDKRESPLAAETRHVAEGQGWTRITQSPDTPVFALSGPGSFGSGGGLLFWRGLFAFEVGDTALAFLDFVILLAHNSLLSSQLRCL
jgi:hypothetical protein